MLMKPQPVSSAISRHKRLTSSYVPSMGTTVAAYDSACSTLALSRSAGMQTYAGSPPAAAAAAVAPARLPVEAHARAGRLKSTARAAAIAAGRSLKDKDGLRVSSLIHSRSTPSTGARRAEAVRGVEPRGGGRR